MLQFHRLSYEHLDLVYEWRKSDFVSKFMITTMSIEKKDHYIWFENICNNLKFKYWVIFFKNIPIGLINLAEIDYINRNLSAGYYIGDKSYRSIGAMVPPYLYNYVFGEMQFRKIYGQVVAGNDGVLKMHALHGFREVGVFKEHLFKNGTFNDLILIELLSENWLQQKKYARYTEKFT